MNQKTLLYAAAAFAVLSIIDIIERWRGAEERNELLRDQRDSLAGMSERMAAHFPYKREVEGPYDHPHTPAHAEVHVDHLSGVSEEVDDG